ncbi:hypothetical protein FACS1894166_13230 [Bacilli bacterium]|nr:hypothetical protein FACS1894166_13230 [Bacilli bacterium]
MGIKKKIIIPFIGLLSCSTIASCFLISTVPTAHHQQVLASTTTATKISFAQYNGLLLPDATNFDETPTDLVLLRLLNAAD